MAKCKRVFWEDQNSPKLDFEYPRPVRYGPMQHPILTTADSFIASQILGGGERHQYELSTKDKTPRFKLCWSHCQKSGFKYSYFKSKVAASLGFECLGQYSCDSTAWSGIVVDDRKWETMPLATAATFLDAFGVLLWYLDNGYAQSGRNIYLRSRVTDSAQINELVTTLNQKFGFHIRVRDLRIRERTLAIIFSVKSFQALIDLNRDKIPYIPGEMWHKLDMKYRETIRPAYWNLRTKYDFPYLGESG